MRKYRVNSAEKDRARAKIWREKNRLQRLYGISNEQWKEMFIKQGGKCLICFTHGKYLARGLVVDHCHKTQKVRGLLCDSCNRAIGFLKEDRNLFYRAINYLQK